MTHAQLLSDVAHTVAASYRSPLVRVTRTIWIRADKVSAFNKAKG